MINFTLKILALIFFQAYLFPFNPIIFWSIVGIMAFIDLVKYSNSKQEKKIALNSELIQHEFNNIQAEELEQSIIPKTPEHIIVDTPQVPKKPEFTQSELLSIDQYNKKLNKKLKK